MNSEIAELKKQVDALQLVLSMMPDPGALLAETRKSYASALSGVVLGSLVKTTTYTFSEIDYTVFGDATGGAFSVLLPAISKDGRICNIMKTDVSANAVTLDGNGKNINGAATKVISTQFTAHQVQYSSAADAWFII